MPPYRGYGKIVGIEENGLNYLCEFVDMCGRKRQVKLHVSKLKPYHSRSPLKFTILQQNGQYFVRKYNTTALISFELGALKSGGKYDSNDVLALDVL